MTWECNFILLQLVSSILCFNIDVDNAIILSPKELSITDRTYFGYSVGIRPRAVENYNNSNWVIQIGAPQVNDFSIKADKPGGVYRCSVDGNCSLAPLNSRAKSDTPSNDQKNLTQELMDGAWIGVAMEFVEDPDAEMSLVCGHRFGYEYKRQMGRYLRIGVCYLENLSSGIVTKLIPLRSEDRIYYKNAKNEAIDYDWGEGLAGMSAKFSTSGLLLGAPAVKSTSGTVVLYPYRNSTRYPSVPETSKRKIWHRCGYYGYSVARGKFFEDTYEWFAMGAPRINKLQGGVNIFRIKSDDTIDEHRRNSIIYGHACGEYFGASMAVADVNNDGYDDLFVGAPMFAYNGHIDQGRMYVYKGGKDKFSPENGEPFDALAGGRFGTCIQALGDIDLDGYPDIAVGAPYVSGGGAVYIYRGGVDGLHKTPSQTILASHVPNGKSLRGFGISISPAVDIDGDHFPEIAVGAYLSNQVVLMRARPVVTLNISIQHPKILDRKYDTAINITCCVSYNGTHAPQNIGNVKINIVADRGRDRGVSANSNGTASPLELEFCIQASPKINKVRFNETWHLPIPISCEAMILDEAKTSSPTNRKVRKWEALRPILSPDSKTSEKAVIEFSGECGRDNKCTSNTSLTCEFRDGKKDLRLGTIDTLVILLTVKNVEEPAKNTTVQMLLSGALTPDVRSKDLSCSQQVDNEVQCNLGTMYASAEKVLKFELRPGSASTASSKKLSIRVKVRTDSVDLSKRTECDLVADLTTDIQISLTPSALTTLPLTRDMPSVQFIHTYYGYKKGLSPVGSVNLFVSVPVSINGLVFGGSSVISVDNPFNEIEGDLFQVSEGYSFSKAGNLILHPARDKRDAKQYKSTTTEKDVPNSGIGSNYTLFVNCSSPGVVCETIETSFSTPIFQHDVPIVLNYSLLENFMIGKKIIVFETNATLSVTDGFGDVSSLAAVAKTTVISPPVQSSVSWKIILLSALAGAFIFTIIFSALLKQGFFRRKAKEQMEALKVEDFIKQRFSLYDVDLFTERKSAESRVSYRTVATPDIDSCDTK